MTIREIKDREAFTMRAIMSLTTELADAKANFQRIEMQVATLAKEYGISVDYPPVG